MSNSADLDAGASAINRFKSQFLRLSSPKDERRIFCVAINVTKKEGESAELDSSHSFLIFYVGRRRERERLV